GAAAPPLSVPRHASRTDGRSTRAPLEAAARHLGGASRARLRRGRDAAPHQVDARGGSRFHRPLAPAAGQRLRASPEPAAGLAASGMAGASRSEIDGLVELAKKAGAKGLVHLAVEADGSVRSPILKFLGDERAARLAAAAGASSGDLVLIVADRDVHAQEAL